MKHEKLHVKEILEKKENEKAHSQNAKIKKKSLAEKLVKKKVMH